MSKSYFSLPFPTFLLFFLVSCSLLMEKEQPSREEWIIHPVTAKTYCPFVERKNISIVSRNPSAQNAFLKFLSVLREKKVSLNFIEMGVLWALVQMNARPDQSAPTARLQVLLNRKGVQEYFDFNVNVPQEAISSLKNTLTPKKTPHLTAIADNKTVPPWPYFYGLSQLLKKEGRSRDLGALALLLEKHFPFPVLVEEELNRFLNQYRVPLGKNQVFKNAYFKDDEVLQNRESLPVPPYQALVSTFARNLKKVPESQIYEVKTFLHPYDTSSLPEGGKVLCNYDLHSYQSSPFLEDKENLPHNLFGIQSADGDALLMVSQQTVGKTVPLENSFLIRGQVEQKNIPMCLLRIPSAFDLFLVAAQGRDPGQHFYHLFKRDFMTIRSLTELDEKLKKARYLFLGNPIRLAFESGRGVKSQLDKLLVLDVPLFHAPRLGQIWAHINFPGEGDHGFVIDDRYKGHISCWSPP